MADLAAAIGVGISIGEEAEHLPVLDGPVPGIAAADAVPVLAADAQAASLPPGAVLNPDRSVTFTLAEPVTIRYRSSAGAAPTEEHFAVFAFRRLKGADMRRVTEAPDGERGLTLIAIATDTPFAKMTLVYDRMDAADANAMGEIASFLVGTGRRTGR